MALAPDEIERYARHLVLAEVGGPGQARIKAARILVVGAGGLGAPLIQYLAAAGIGTIGLVDDDTVSLSNLQRQVIHGTPDLGRPKVESAADAVARLNPHVTVVRHPFRIDAGNAVDLIAGYDLVGAVRAAHEGTKAPGGSGSARVVAVYGPKGGVGRTTVDPATAKTTLVPSELGPWQAPYSGEPLADAKVQVWFRNNNGGGWFPGDTATTRRSAVTTCTCPVSGPLAPRTGDSSPTCVSAAT